MNVAVKLPWNKRPRVREIPDLEAKAFKRLPDPAQPEIEVGDLSVAILDSY
jgi:hypothetical protein